MLRYKKLFIFIVLLIFADLSWGQSRGDYEYSTQKIWGVTKATNSGLIGGFMFKYTTQLKRENSYHGGGIEIVNIKHPQEQKYISTSGNSYIWAKEHYLYSIRLSYYRERVLFKKAQQQGVQVSVLAALGPTIGLEAPYYIEVSTGNGTVKVPYDHTNPNHYWTNIIGTGNILQGVGESSVVPGLNIRLGVSLEFGAFRSKVMGIEVGFQADLFTRKILIIPTTESYSFFPSAYFTFYFGSRK